MKINDKRYYRIIALLGVLMIIIPIYAKTDLSGHWQSEPLKVGDETLIMEYDFKSDSILTMNLVTDNRISNFKRCVSRITIDGSFSLIGQIFTVSLDKETIEVEILKSMTAGKPMSEREMKQAIREIAEPLISRYNNVMIIYVEHENPDEFSFIYGEGDNAIELEFHRPEESVEKVLKINEDEEIDGKNEEITVSKTSSAKSDRMAEGWITLGFFILYLIVAYIIIYLIKFLLVKTIKRTNSAKKSVCIRKIYYVIRLIILISVIMNGAAILLILSGVFSRVNGYFAMSVFIGGAVLLLYLISNLSLPMNFTTMEKFLKKERRYVLYLRGFIADNYHSHISDVAEQISKIHPWGVDIETNDETTRPNNLPLSERDLSNAWKRYAPVYSVGKPEELESPEGCQRIYLDNQTWQKDVLQLMAGARLILIRVISNDNCLWEIQQCSSLYSAKSVYYIENIEILKDALEKMGTNAPECLRSPWLYKNHMYVHQINGEIIVRPYVNTADGFLDSMSYILSDIVG